MPKTQASNVHVSLPHMAPQANSPTYESGNAGIQVMAIGRADQRADHGIRLRCKVSTLVQ